MTDTDRIRPQLAQALEYAARMKDKGGVDIDPAEILAIWDRHHASAEQLPAPAEPEEGPEPEEPAAEPKE